MGTRRSNRAAAHAPALTRFLAQARRGNAASFEEASEFLNELTDFDLDMGVIPASPCGGCSSPLSSIVVFQ
jgi:hypothetical protein